MIRPTTRAPVLVHHPTDASWFDDDRILPGLARGTGTGSDQRSLQLVTDDSLPPGLAILDAPDIDSVVEQNRRLAAQLLAAADLWLFVTSAARYADAVPWDYLIAAAERSAAVAVVCDRVPPRAMQDVPPHLGQMMAERGLAESPLFAVPETVVDEQGLLPTAAIQPIRTWLATLAHDKSSRAEVVHRTLDGAVGAIVTRVPSITQAVVEQEEALSQLRSDADKAWAEAVRAVSVQTADGSLLRGEVLARWHDFVGTGEFFRAMEQKIGWLRDRIVATLKGEPPEARNVKVAVESGMEALIRAEGEAAAERSEAAWQANPAGRALVEQSRDDLAHPSSEFGIAAARMIRDWQGDVLELVAEEGMGKRSKARFLALGVNGVGVALMILVFSQTGGLVGAEIGVAGGTAVLAQRVLEGVFGDQAVRRLAELAKTELDQRVQNLMADELVRYHRTLTAVTGDPERATRLSGLVTEIDAARVAGLTAGAVGGVADGAEAVRDRDDRALPAGRASVQLTTGPVVDGVYSAADYADAAVDTPSGQAGPAVGGEIVDAEIVASPARDDHGRELG